MNRPGNELSNRSEPSRGALRGFRFALVALWVSCVFGVPSVRADASEEDVAQARALFVSGQAAVEAGRWSDAVTNFKRAYELSEVPTALYNLGFALRALGRHRDSRDAFARLIDAHSDFDPERLEQAVEYRDEAQSRLAVIEILELADAIEYRISFDGRRVTDEGDRPLAIDTDPGSHTLAVRHDESSPFLWEGRVEEGEVLQVTYEAGLGAVGGPSADADDGPSVFESPWFWVVTVGIVAAGAAVGLFFYWDSMQLDPNNPDRVARL